MARQSSVRKAFMAEAVSKYHAALTGSPGEEYLVTRGLMAPSVSEAVGKYRLGYVEEPLPGHEQYRGMLAIPYLRRSVENEWSVASIRFRRVGEGTGSKYLTQAGDKPRLFNTVAAIDNDDFIAITEGEIDAITASICGIPAVGVPGVEAWKPAFTEIFKGYETVWILADNDEIQYRKKCPKCKGDCVGHNPGMEFANKMAQELPNAKIIPMDKGHDVNSMVTTYGKKSLLERVK